MGKMIHCIMKNFFVGRGHDHADAPTELRGTEFHTIVPLCNQPATQFTNVVGGGMPPPYAWCILHTLFHLMNILTIVYPFPKDFARVFDNWDALRYNISATRSDSRGW